MHFVDELTLFIQAGDGGNGAVAFRRERFRPRGGPAGGDGGRGGDVIFIADRNLNTLFDLSHQPRIVAKRGEDGKGNDCHGRSAKSISIRVPVGTIVHDEETGQIIGDLNEHGQELCAAAGGAGGRGNMHFASPSNRAPRKAEPGEPGESLKVRLELQLLADVGIVGLPNVGKSTLISRLSAARPKIADYPFTTLVPNLGVVQSPADSSFVVADIPGIIRGAASGAGLGLQFLKHLQRTAVIVQMIAPVGDEQLDLDRDYRDLISEIRSFDPELVSRIKILLLNKSDLPEVRAVAAQCEELAKQENLEFYTISAATGEGLKQLKSRLAKIVSDQVAS